MNPYERILSNLKWWIKTNYTTQKNFCDHHPFHESEITKYLSGEREPGLIKFLNICDALGLEVKLVMKVSKTDIEEIKD